MIVVSQNAITKLPAPRVLGRYEVGAKIAGGGMASVYLGRAVDDAGKEQLVALKVIKDELAHDENFIHMFLDEAKILSKLSHPNIIRTLEYGVSGEHRFIAMELLLGRSLQDVWEVCFAVGQKLPPQRELASTLEVGRHAVREALALLEAENYIVTKRGAQGGSFGWATTGRAASGRPSGSSRPEW